MSEQMCMWGWCPAVNRWVKMQVDVNGRLVVDPSDLFEEPPVNGEMEKAATSNWSFDHDADPDAHHARQHALDSAADHTGAITDAQHGVRALANAHAHADLSGIGADNHHNRQHALNSAPDHTGAITDAQHGVRTLANAHAHADLSGIGADNHHNRQHALNSAPDHTGEITDAQHGVRTLANAHAHADLSGIGVADHHARYTDAEAIAAAKTDATLLNYTQGARVYHNANQTINDATGTAVAFNSERWDTDTIHDTVTNNSYLTCKTAGKYLIIFSAVFAACTSRIYFNIRLNGLTIIASTVGESSVSGILQTTCTTIYDLAVNDYVEAIVWQNSGGALALQYLPEYSPEFMMQRIG